MQREQLAESEKLMANLNDSISHRNSAQSNRFSQNIGEALARSTEFPAGTGAKSLDSELPFDEINKARNSQAGCLYRRATLSEVTFDDFELISIIGRGTFGKVYLVSNKISGTYYAMKCIRKDVVI